MPIYEYACRQCGHEFEQLVSGDRAALCPSCQSQELTKKFSVFALSGQALAKAPPMAAAGPCGSCGDPRGPGACSMN